MLAFQYPILSRRPSTGQGFHSHKQPRTNRRKVDLNSMLFFSDYWLDNRGSIPAGQRIFLLATASRPALQSIQTPIQWVRVSFPAVKQTGPEADHSSSCSAEVKEEWSYTSTTLHAFMARCLISTRNNFTFYCTNCIPVNYHLMNKYQCCQDPFNCTENIPKYFTRNYYTFSCTQRTAVSPCAPVYSGRHVNPTKFVSL